MKRIFSVFTLAAILIITPSAFAKTKTFTKEYTYQASEADSKLSCRTVALEQVKRLLLEELGTYLQSKTEVKNYKLTTDQVTILAAGIVRTEIIDEKWDGKNYRLKARITVNPSEVTDSINKLRSDRQQVRGLEDARKKANNLLEDSERLKNELKTAKDDSKESKQKEFIETMNGLSAIDWYQKGFSLITLTDYSGAVKAFDSAIELAPTFTDAYFYRGMAYSLLGLHKQAVADLNTVVEMNPDSSESYVGRANIYTRLGDLTAAVIDLKKAVKLNPENAEAFSALALVGFLQDRTDRDELVISMCNKAIELDPAKADAYFMRGYSFYESGERQRGIDDMRTAARLGYESAQSFLREKNIYW